MTDILDAPGVHCIECEKSCGDSEDDVHWFGEAGPLCEACYITIWAEFQKIAADAWGKHPPAAPIPQDRKG